MLGIELIHVSKRSWQAQQSAIHNPDFSQEIHEYSQGKSSQGKFRSQMFIDSAVRNNSWFNVLKNTTSQLHKIMLFRVISQNNGLGSYVSYARLKNGRIMP